MEHEWELRLLEQRQELLKHFDDQRMELSQNFEDQFISERQKLLDECEARMQQMREQIAHLEEELQERVFSADNLLHEVQEEKNAKVELQKQLDNALNLLEQEKSLLAQERETCQQEAKARIELEKSIEELLDEMERKRQEIEQKKGDLGGWQSKTEELSSSLNELSSSLNEKSSINDKLERRLSTISEQLESHVCASRLLKGEVTEEKAVEENEWNELPEEHRTALMAIRQQREKVKKLQAALKSTQVSQPRWHKYEHVMICTYVHWHSKVNLICRRQLLRVGH